MTVRGCGTRIAGGIYAVCPMGKGGRPVEEFLFDPPLTLPERLNLAPQGVAVLPRSEDDTSAPVTHLADWVGSKYYPNVADFIEEVRRFGLSRRLPRSLDFTSFGVESRIFLVHSRAILVHPERYRPEASEGVCAFHCPKQESSHEEGATMCAGMWWEDVDGGTPVENDDEATAWAENRLVMRSMESFSYEGMRRPDGVRGSAIAGFFASFPIFGIEVVRDRNKGKHEQALEHLKDCPLDVDLVDE